MASPISQNYSKSTKLLRQQPVLPMTVLMAPQGFNFLAPKKPQTAFSRMGHVPKIMGLAFLGKIAPVAGLLGGTRLIMDQNGPGFLNCDTFHNF